MSLSRNEIVNELIGIVGKGSVVTDENVLKESSIDRFRKYESICGVFTRPIPAAIVKVRSTEEVSRVLKFMNDNNLNAVPRTGGQRRKAAWKRR